MVAVQLFLLVTALVGASPTNGALRVARAGAAVGGEPSVPTEFPWLVGVYRDNGKGRFQQICGGSLIGPDLVVSAAHCFWNKGNPIPLSEYRITAGNYYRDFYNKEKKDVLKVKNVKLHERYRDSESNYAHDIAIVRLDGRANTALPTIKTIAIDWNSEFDESKLKWRSGNVVGWGFTDNEKPSDVRIAVRLPYINFDTCWKAVPQAFRVFVTPDKFCAGHRNGTAVCPGDSGGGLAFWDMIAQVWYLRGIVSVGVTPEGVSQCHRTQYSAFTSIASNYLWLKSNVNDGKGSQITFPN